MRTWSRSGGSLLTTDDVEPGEAAMIPFIAMEANMEQGTKLVAIFDPGAGQDGRPGQLAARGADVLVNALPARD